MEPQAPLGIEGEPRLTAHQTSNAVADQIVAPPQAQSGIFIAALALSDDAVTLDEFATLDHDRVALVLGSEGDGLSHAALAHCDAVVTIPMSSGVNSLNVAAASAVALWAIRPRRA